MAKVLAAGPVTNSRVVSARRDAVVLTVLITAVMLLIWNGSTFFQQLRIAGDVGPEVRIASTALTLNVALILFGWRRYVDLHHEAELRQEQERHAAVLASTDPVTGLYNRKGFADHVAELCARGSSSGCHLAIISFQVQRFKAINDQHGYDIGDRLLKGISDALADELGPGAVIARLSGDEFAVALELAPADIRRAEQFVRSANARVGVALGNFLPQIGLTALYGGVSSDLSAITSSGAGVWSVAANVAGPVFQGGRLSGQYQQSKADLQEAKLQYQQAALGAFHDVANALVSRQKLEAVRVQQSRAVAAYQEAVTVSTQRYLAGKASYYEVLEAQQQLFPAENSLAQTQLNQLLVIVQLYKALGGGWQKPEITPK